MDACTKDNKKECDLDKRKGLIHCSTDSSREEVYQTDECQDNDSQETEQPVVGLEVLWIRNICSSKNLNAKLHAVSSCTVHGNEVETIDRVCE